MDYLSSDKIAIVDLATSEVYEEELDEDLVMDRIGGVGITTHLFERFREDEPIVFGTGLLTGTLVPGSSLGIITAMNPTTGGVCHAPFCQYAAMEMKYAGFDYVVVKGTSEKPAYLWLHDGIADIQDASDYWSKTPWELTDLQTGLRKEFGDELLQMLTIGQAGEDGSDIAQIMVNCWSSGDRWGFGKVMGEKRLKAIAVRGMGLFEVADPEGFVNICLELISAIKTDGLLAGKKGCIEFPALLGEEDIIEWISPLVHRHSSCFNTPYPTNTFVKYNEDPKILKETSVEEPGFLITDIYGLLGFKNMGLSAEAACRMLDACTRYGVDPAAASAALKDSGKMDLEDLKKELPNLKRPQAHDTSKFSPWSPPSPLFADFGLPADGSKDAQWWERRQAVSYVFGIHPIFSLMVPQLTEEKLIELVNIGADLSVTAEVLDKVIADVC